MKAWTTFRRWLAGLMLLAVAVGGIGMPAYLMTVDGRFHQKARGQEDDVSRALRRMRPVLWAEPGEVHLGYLCDLPMWSYGWMERYFRAQFALAPHVLHQQAGENQFVVIDAADDAQARQLAAAHGLIHPQRVGEGVLIAQRN